MTIDYQYIKQTFVMADGCSTGTACMLSVCKFYQTWCEPWVLERWSGVKGGMVSLGGLRNAFGRLGFHCEVTQMNLEQLRHFSTPVILFFDTEKGKKDFVVCYGFDGDRYIVGDTSWGLMQYWPDEMEVMWIKGICMILFPNETFGQEERDEERIGRYLKRCLKANRRYWGGLSVGIVAIAGTIGCIRSWYSEFFPLLGFLLLLCGEVYVCAVAYLKWKSRMMGRFENFWEVLTERVDYMDPDRLCLALNGLPRTAVGILMFLTLYAGGLGYLVYQGSFLSWVYLLYVPFVAYGIGRYRLWLESHLPAKRNGEPVLLKDLRKMAELKTGILSLLSALLAGWLCWPAGWLGGVAAVAAWLATDILCRLRSARKDASVFLSVYTAYRRGGKE